MTDVAKPKTQLEARLSELNKRLHSIEDELDAHQSKDWEELAVEREEDEVLEHLGNAGLVEIEAINLALKRIEEGVYGICLSCGEDISEGRLALLPATGVCAPCAQKAAS